MSLSLPKIHAYLDQVDLYGNAISKAIVEQGRVPRLTGRCATNNLSDWQELALWQRWHETTGMRDLSWDASLRMEGLSRFQEFQRWLLSRFF